MRLGLKKNETRSWWCGHRGWLAIQAAKKVYKPSDYEFEFNQAVQSAGIWPHHLTTTYGSVLCIVRMVGCEKTERIADRTSEREKFWGNYDAGRYAWITDPTNRIVLDDPIPIRGHQGLFDWEISPEIAELIKAKEDNSCLILS
jgi:hypothetical protein